MLENSTAKVTIVRICANSPMISSHGEIRRTGGPTGQKLIRSDKSRLFSGPKDQQTMHGRQMFL